MAAFEAHKINKIRALQNHVLVTDMNFDQRVTASGIIIQNTDGKLEGIHARWGRVYAIGTKQKDVKVGQYVLVKHGRWTRGIEIEDADGEHTLRRIDHNDILLVRDTPTVDEIIGRGLT